jgi:3-methyl-2-oxobutanoate hydroxymethyltransferase
MKRLMADPLTKRFTLQDLRRARKLGTKVPMLTCYDYTTARLMQQAGVAALLVGDSAGNVILGYDSTIPVPLDFMIQITAAVRRGAPLAFLVADMPFGSYAQGVAQGVGNVVSMLQLSGCDCVKLEVSAQHLDLVQALAGNGIAVMAHLGLRPQAVGLIGGYRVQARTPSDAKALVALALQMEHAGAAAILLEAVPTEAAARVVEAVKIPVIGCGAGHACDGSVVVVHDALNLTPRPPKFAPRLADIASPLVEALSRYVDQVTSGAYPGPEHAYESERE